jgi:adenylate cyclase, class 2
VPIEHEIKLPVDGLVAIRKALAEAGARLEVPLELEQNWVLDHADNALARSGELLRVRRAGARSWLTHKGPATFAAGVKNRQELEVSVGDAAATVAILEALGFAVLRRYEKRRETWHLAAVVVALDETPMGPFVELEGPPQELASAARRLGLDPDSAVRGTYLDLWSSYRDRHPGAPADMVFA